ncbi:hypothetical protein EMCRGX_G001538 [Ephydatia muelleri]
MCVDWRSYHSYFPSLFVALLCGPAAVYQYLSQYKASDEGATSNTSRAYSSSQQCYPKSYTGSCLGALQSCMGGGAGGRGGTVWISSAVNVADSERQVSTVTTLLQGDPGCLNSSHRFLCQYLFPPCDGNGTLYLPTYQECVVISTGACKEAWQLAQARISIIKLPDCGSLPNTTSICSSNTSTQSSFQVTPLCSDGYYFNGTFCLARCGVWEQYSPPVAKAVVVTELLAATFGSATELVLIALFIHQRKRMFRFPSVFIIYHTVCYFIIVVFGVINHSVPYSDLFCSKESVIETYASKPTAFCTVSGVILQYFFVSMCWWWLFHIASVFWLFIFPLHAKLNFMRVGCLHGILVAGGVLLPLPGVVIALATGGYTIGRHPPLLCTTKDPRVFYYSVVLLSSGILAAGLSMLVVLYWTLYKRARSLQSSSAEENARNRRLLVVLTYYVLFGTLAITQQSLELGQFPRIKAALQETFTCEAAGLGRSNVTTTCPTLYQEYSYPAFGCVVYLMMGLIPVANMVFVLPAWQLWKYCFGGAGGGGGGDGGGGGGGGGGRPSKPMHSMKSSTSSTTDL